MGYQLHLNVSNAAKLLACAGGMTVFLFSILIVMDVILRYTLSASILYSFELTRYGFAIAFAFSLADGILSRSHVRIDILYNLFSLRVRAILDVVAITLMALMSSGLAILAIRMSADTYNLGGRSATTLALPLALPQSVWAFGLSFFALTCIYLLIRTVLAVLRAQWSTVNKLSGMR